MAKRWSVLISVEDRGAALSPIISTPLLECLRYAGVCSSPRRYGNSKDQHGIQFNLYPPKGTGNPEVWAQQTADNMMSHGIMAEKVET